MIVMVVTAAATPMCRSTRANHRVSKPVITYGHPAACVELAMARVASEALVSLRFRGVYAWICCACAVFLLGCANAVPSRCLCLDMLCLRGVFARLRKRCAFAVSMSGCDALSRCLCLVMLRFRRGVCVWLRCAFAVVGCAEFSRCIC